MKYFSTKSNFLTKSVSRLLTLTPNIDETREIFAVEIRDMAHWNEVEKCFAYFSAVLYHGLYKPQLFSRTGSAARVSCGVWYSTQETDAEPVYSYGINSTRVPSPLAASGTGKMGGKNNPRKPLQSLEAACAVYGAILKI